MTSIKHFLPVLIFSLFVYHSNAQENDQIIDKNYHGIPITDFIDSIQNRYHYSFYFIRNEINSITVVQKDVTEGLNQILENSFSNSPINFIIDEKNIFISKDYKIIIPEIELFEDTTLIDNSETSFSKIVNKINSGNENLSDIFNIGNPQNSGKENYIELYGTIRELETGQTITGVAVALEAGNKYTISDAYGYFVLKIPRGKNRIIFTAVGREEKIVEVNAYESGQVNINLENKIIQLQDVIITANQEYNVHSVKTGEEKVFVKTLKLMPSSVGEVDIIKSALLLPGIQTVGEGAAGFNVRGGNTDQNLVLLDEAPIFNTSHFFGFYSVFNSEIINSFNLYKSSIPANYGGRLSSVLDISTRSGNTKKYSLSGGIGPITGKLLFEGPIIKEKASIILCARNTYSNYILNQIESFNFNKSKASFGDLNIKINAELNEKNSLSFSNYASRDFYNLISDTTYKYSNLTSSLHWKHSFFEKMYAKFALIYSKYNFSLSGEKETKSAFEMNYYIDYKEFKTDFTFLKNENHRLSLGFNAIFYDLMPGEKIPGNDSSVIKIDRYDNEKALESAIYINDEIKINSNLSMDMGVRVSGFFNLGPGKVYIYKKDVPKSILGRIDSVLYGKNEIMNKFIYPEFRFSTRYKFNNESSLKMSYASMNQYLHMLSNTTAISPTDVWKLSNSNIKPCKGHQFSLGFYKNFENNTIESSIEAYYKTNKNIPEYKPGAELFMNQNIETDLLAGIGNAYGIELMIKKKYGKLNGWFSYTYARSLVKVSGKYLEETINKGKYYPANYDKPNDVNIVVNYMFSRRLSFSAVVKYSTGRPITYPVAKYQFKDIEIVHYSDRNSYRVPDYFRIDFSINLEGSLKSKKIAHNSWSFSIYNLTGRNNVYSIFFINEDNIVQGYKLSIFARPVPTITYNFKF